VVSAACLGLAAKRLYVVYRNKFGIVGLGFTVSVKGFKGRMVEIMLSDLLKGWFGPGKFWLDGNLERAKDGRV